jgi:hypothetical protein
MAFTRQRDDPCMVKKSVEESTSILSYLMDPNKFYHCNPCFITRGVVGGNTTSLYKGNMVDLESDLNGRTRVASKCPSGQFLPGTIVQATHTYQCGPECGLNGLPCGNPNCKQNQLVHLPTCQLVDYKPRPTSVGYTLDPMVCPPPESKKEFKKDRKNLYSPNEWQGQQGLARY